MADSSDEDGEEDVPMEIDNKESSKHVSTLLDATFQIDDSKRDSSQPPLPLDETIQDIQPEGQEVLREKIIKTRHQKIVEKKSFR